MTTGPLPAIAITMPAVIRLTDEYLAHFLQAINDSWLIRCWHESCKPTQKGRWGDLENWPRDKDPKKSPVNF